MIRVMDNDTHRRIQWWKDKERVQGSYALLYDYGSILVHINGITKGWVKHSDHTITLLALLSTGRKTPQAHGYIVVEFHLEVFEYHSFIFSQRKVWCKVSSMDMVKITWLYNIPKFITRVSHDKYWIVWHTLKPISRIRIKERIKNKRIYLN
jgi:hypothetical protein